MSIPESATLLLASLFDRSIERATGRTAQFFLDERPLSNKEYKRLAAMDVEDLPDDLFLRFKGNQLRLAFGWAWFTLASVALIVGLTITNLLQVGTPRHLVYAVVTVMASSFMGNWCVCLATGYGRIIFGRLGGGTPLWVIVTVTSCLYMLAIR